MLIPQRYEFSSKSQHPLIENYQRLRCCWYHKGTNFQANHNKTTNGYKMMHVVADTTKVRIFKQITTASGYCKKRFLLLLIPQRYEFSSKSQRILLRMIFFLRCCWYHKGTNFQANHNWYVYITNLLAVVADTTKVRIFKQITTPSNWELPTATLLLIPQRYEFSSKSQRIYISYSTIWCCCWYHKGTNFQANHNETR